MSNIERERIRRRVAAALEGEEYSVIEMAYDLERLATHPVWEQADRCASELEGAVDLLRWALPYLPEPLPSMDGGAYAENYDRAVTLSANTPTGGSSG